METDRQRVYRPGLHRWSVLLAFGTLLLVVAGGLGGPIFLLPRRIPTPHALLAQLFFPTTVAMAIFTSDWWLKAPLQTDEKPKFPVRGLSFAAPFFVPCQLAMRAAARHKAIGSIYHISWSPVVTGVILWVSLRILLHYAQSRELRIASVTLPGIAFCQVFPGIAAFMTCIACADAVHPMPLMVTFTVLHVAVGALTMAAGVVLVILVRRNMPAPSRSFAGARIAAAS